MNNALMSTISRNALKLSKTVSHKASPALLNGIRTVPSAPESDTVISPAPAVPPAVSKIVATPSLSVTAVPTCGEKLAKSDYRQYKCTAKGF